MKPNSWARSFWGADNPKVSIILPARNEEEFLGKCLDSLMNQDYPNYEIIIIDDSSEDSTGKIISKYAKHMFVESSLSDFVSYVWFVSAMVSVTALNTLNIHSQSLELYVQRFYNALSREFLTRYILNNFMRMLGLVEWQFNDFFSFLDSAIFLFSYEKIKVLLCVVNIFEMKKIKIKIRNLRNFNPK